MSHGEGKEPQLTYERFDASVLHAMALHHFHRYLAVTSFCIGKDVLDIACGTGYGSALLAQSARTVTGVDVDASAIEACKVNYCRTCSNLTFRKGDVADIPYPDASFDVLVSFETIEHVDAVAQEKFMCEIRRVLRPDGLLVISSPSKDAAHSNAFHVHELEEGEFHALLEARFRNCAYFRQKIVLGSFIRPDARNVRTTAKLYGILAQEGQLTEPCVPDVDSKYTIALASDGGLPKLVPSVNLDVSGAILEAFVRQNVMRSTFALRTTIDELRTSARVTHQRLIEQNDREMKLRSEIELRKGREASLRDGIAKHAARAESLRQTVDACKATEAKLRAAMETEREREASLRDGIAKHAARAESLRQTVDACKATEAKLRAVIESNKTVEAKLHSEIDLRKEREASLRDGIAKHAARAESLRQTVDACKATEAKLRSEIELRKGREVSLRDGMAKHAARAESLRQTVDACKATESHLRSEIELRKERERDLTGEIAQDKAKIKELRDRIASYRTYSFSPDERRYLRRLAFLHPIRCRRLAAEMRLIASSPLFDAEYYGRMNVEAGKTPLLHFCLQGWQNGRNPSAYFDIDSYLDRDQTCDPHENPLVHFLRGDGEGMELHG